VTLRVLVNIKLNMSQECALAAKEVNSFLDCNGKSVSSRLKGPVQPAVGDPALAGGLD